MKNLFISTLIMLSISFAYAEDTTNPNTQKYSKLEGVRWIRPPKPVYTNNDLQGKDRTLTIKIYVKEDGTVDRSEVTKSSGLAALDSKVQRAVKSAKFRPYKENGIAYPFIAEQPFKLELGSAKYSNDTVVSQSCTYSFQSQHWDTQSKATSAPFNYESKPQLRIFEYELENKDRTLDIEFKLSRKNEVSDLRVITSSGLKKLDDEVSHAISKTKITASRKFYQFYKLKFTDHIYFNLKDCE